MKLCLPLGVSAVEITAAVAGGDIKVAAFAGDKQIDKFFFSDSKAPKRQDEWIVEAYKIASQPKDATHELQAVIAHCDGITIMHNADTRNVWERAAIAEAGVTELNGLVAYFKQRYEETFAELKATKERVFFDTPPSQGPAE